MISAYIYTKGRFIVSRAMVARLKTWRVIQKNTVFRCLSDNYKLCCASSFQSRDHRARSCCYAECSSRLQRYQYFTRSTALPIRWGQANHEYKDCFLGSPRLCRQMHIIRKPVSVKVAQPQHAQQFEWIFISLDFIKWFEHFVGNHQWN